MPFDGLTYLAPTNKPSLWERVVGYITGTPPVTKPLPTYLFHPTPATQPDTLTLQMLMIGRALIEDRKNWIQGRYETRGGRRCAVGALRAAARRLNIPTTQNGAHAVLLSVAMERGFNDIERMNDNSTHRQVLRAFDDAITFANIQSVPV
jgi:hypothetical protein